MAIRFIARCKDCGETSTSYLGTSDGKPPLLTPTVPGKCPSNPNGVHRPYWEERK